MTGEVLFIYWKGELIGELLKPISDMWYVEGTFKSYQNQTATAFENLARKLDLKTVFNDPEIGERIEYTSHKGLNIKRYPAIVLSLVNDRLVIRMMTER